MDNVKNLKDMFAKSYYYILQWFIWIAKGESWRVPDRAIEGGARFSGKTFHYFMLLFLACAYQGNTVGVVVRLKGSKQVPDTWKQMLLLIKWMGLSKDIKSTNKSEWDITFHNGSTISLRSVFDPQGNVSMKGVTRDMDAQLAIIINEECNTFTVDQLGMAEEAVSADKTFRFDLFNTDSIKQHIVNELQENLNVNMTTMKSKGYQQTVKREIIQNKAGEDVPFKTWLRRSNHLPIKEKIKDGDYKKLMRLEKLNPERARVAVWGDNGATGKVVFYSLTNEHFIKPSDYGLPEKLPSNLFKRYRIGIDTASQHDIFAVTLSGVTHQNRLIAIEAKGWMPPEEGELDMKKTVNETFDTIINEWGVTYSNMRLDTRIRVETAGNGTMVRQKLKTLMLKSGWDFKIDKAKKTIETKSSQGNVGSMQGQSQPILEERVAAENGFFSSDQKLFYNIPQIVQNQYEMSRDEDGKIPTNGGDDFVQAFQYGEIPEYKSMWQDPPKISFKEELSACGIKI